MYSYGLIGNCQVSALISGNASIDWLCFPRPDSPPTFGKILDEEGGHFSIAPQAPFTATSNYLPNTNVLVTHFRLDDGSEFQVTDFCPRFNQHGRMYRPASLFRVIEPLKGSPSLKVSCRPVNGWDKTHATAVRGNSHLKFEFEKNILRLTTNMPLTYLCEEAPFLLQEKTCFGLTWGSAIEDDLIKVTNEFLQQTISYWRTWVKHCSIPSAYQRETIRSALALKLHCYEDTGAILAALTTSLPESAGEGRNWDYRFCWLRDAYFSLSAFHNLGHFEEMEGFLKFLLGIAHKQEHSKDRLHPVYSLDQQLPIPEKEHANWRGFLDSKPVRSNNQAAEHVQNDVYGEMILTLAPIYLDERFYHLRTKEHEDLLKHLAKFCVQNISKPDAGLWEFRDKWQEHSFSNLMSWAGLDRIIQIKQRGFINNLDSDLEKEREKAKQAVLAATREGSLRNGPQDLSLDASLLQLPLLRFPDSELNLKTVETIAKDLRFNEEAQGFLYRYLRADDFGRPKSAFLVCSFWLVQAFAKLGQKDRADMLMNQTFKAANGLGLFAEHFLPREGLQCGNFPQAYSHVGQINAAFAVSPSWDQIL